MNELCPHGRHRGAVCLECDAVDSWPTYTVREDGYMQLEKPAMKNSKKSDQPNGSAEAILYAAAKAIADRSSTRDNGDEKSMKRTVGFFNMLADTGLTEREGWLFLACVKLCRSQQGDFHVDDYIDAASYIALAGESEASEYSLR